MPPAGGEVVVDDAEVGVARKCAEVFGLEQDNGDDNDDKGQKPHNDDHGGKAAVFVPYFFEGLADFSAHI